MVSSRMNTEMIVPELTAKPRKGYARGAKGVEQILRTAEQLLIDEGAAALTLRRIAADCGMNQSNLSYYFKTKDALIFALVDAIARSYRAASERIELPPNTDPVERLRELVLVYLDNVMTRRTTRVFIELWALASRNAEARQRLKAIYDGAVDLFAAAIAAANPAFPPSYCRKVALYVVTLLEGHTVTIGHDMPYTDHRDELVALAWRSIEQIVRPR